MTSSDGSPWNATGRRGERLDPGRDHHPGRPHLLPILQEHLEVIRPALDVDHAATVHLRNGRALKPLAIVDERIQRYRLAELAPARLLVAIQGEIPIREADMAGVPGRTQQHAPRHPRPERHRLAEHPHITNPQPTQMRSRRQAIRPRPHDHYISHRKIRITHRRTSAKRNRRNHGTKRSTTTANGTGVKHSPATKRGNALRTRATRADRTDSSPHAQGTVFRT